MSESSRKTVQLLKTHRGMTPIMGLLFALLLIAGKLLVASATAPLTVAWSEIPQVPESNIVGAVRVSNSTQTRWT